MQNLPRSPQRDLGIPIVDMILDTGPVSSPRNMVYSTSPHVVIGKDNSHYVMKGFADLEIVKAEAAGYILANELEIPVPSFALIWSPESPHLLFGSKMIIGLRDLDQYANDPRLQDWNQISNLIIFDIWVANDDRNAGSILVQQLGENQYGWIAIDFEKSKTLSGPHPRWQSGSVPPKDLWPTDHLGRLLQGLRPTREFVHSVQILEENLISSLLQPIENSLGITSDWADRQLLCFPNVLKIYQS